MFIYFLLHKLKQDNASVKKCQRYISNEGGKKRNSLWKKNQYMQVCLLLGIPSNLRNVIMYFDGLLKNYFIPFNKTFNPLKIIFISIMIIYWKFYKYLKDYKIVYKVNNGIFPQKIKNTTIRYIRTSCMMKHLRRILVNQICRIIGQLDKRECIVR